LASNRTTRESQTLDEWADRYGQLLPTGAPSASAWISIPMLVASLLGLLWSLPLPEVLDQRSPVLNWATMFLMASFVYYCILSIPIALVSLAFMLAASLPSVWLDSVGMRIWPLALGIFVPAFAWQLALTLRATGSFRVIRNLQYLMLGPVWLLRAIFRRMGISY
jgi:hypothetical protein